MNESGPLNARSALLAGFPGQGCKFSPAMGGIAANLALVGRTTQPIDSITTNGRAAACARTR
jgi:sarcosine oxidase